MKTAEHWPNTKLSGGLGRTNPATKWLDGEISTGKMLQECGVPQMQGLELVGMIWHAMRDKIEAFDAELENKINVANNFKALADAGDNKQVTPQDAIEQPIRATVLAEARYLLDFRIKSCFRKTEVGAL